MSQGLKKGTTLQNGTYRIENVLGQGSFGITYLAVHVRLKKKVAIKEFFMGEVNSRKDDGSSVEGSTGRVFMDYRRKFRKEAENLASLNHANIVNVSDIFDENGTTYYVMDFVEGINLDKYINENGHINETEAIAITVEIGKALEYMHSKGMLHLDIKPSNVMRGSDGKYYLIDFGLSKQFSKDGRPEETTSIGLGTPGYAPIEQSSYKEDGTFPATLDVYALGATLYKMLTGNRPPEATYVLNDGFTVCELEKTGVSKQTVKVLRKAMMSSYKRRYQAVKDFLLDLNQLNKKNQDDYDSDEITLVSTENDVKSTNVRRNNTLDFSLSWIKRLVGFQSDKSSVVDLIIRCLLYMLLIFATAWAIPLLFVWFLDSNEINWIELYDRDIITIFLYCIVTIIGILFLLRKKKYGLSVLIIGYILVPFPTKYRELDELLLYVVPLLLGCLILWGILSIKIKGISAWSRYKNFPKPIRKGLYVVVNIYFLIIGYFIFLSQSVYTFEEDLLLFTILPLLVCLIIWGLMNIKIKGISSWDRYTNIPKSLRIVQYGFVSMCIFMISIRPVVALNTGFIDGLYGYGEMIIRAYFCKDPTYSYYLYKDILYSKDFSDIPLKKERAAIKWFSRAQSFKDKANMNGNEKKDKLYSELELILDLLEFNLNNYGYEVAKNYLEMNKKKIDNYTIFKEIEYSSNREEIIRLLNEVGIFEEVNEQPIVDNLEKEIRSNEL